MSLESDVEDGEWFRCPDFGREFIPPLRCPNFAEQALFALSDGGTSWPADVVEWSALCVVWPVFGGLESDAGRNRKPVEVTEDITSYKHRAPALNSSIQKTFKNLNLLWTYYQTNELSYLKHVIAGWLSVGWRPRARLVFEALKTWTGNCELRSYCNCKC